MMRVLFSSIVAGAVVLVFVGVLPGVALAQESLPAQSPRTAELGQSPTAVRQRDISASLSVGLAREVEDYFLTSPNWIGAVRLGRSKHLAFEGEIGYWSGSKVDDHIVDLRWNASGPTILEPTSLHSEFSIREWHVGVSLIGRLVGRRVSFSGGAGLGVWKQKGETLSEAQSLSDPTHHNLFTNTWNRTGIGAHGLASIDISITRRIQTFGAGRIEFVPQLDTLLLAVHGGVRVLF